MYEGPSRGVYRQIQLWDPIRQKATHKNQLIGITNITGPVHYYYFLLYTLRIVTNITFIIIMSWGNNVPASLLVCCLPDSPLQVSHNIYATTPALRRCKSVVCRPFLKSLFYDKAIEFARQCDKRLSIQRLFLHFVLQCGSNGKRVKPDNLTRYGTFQRGKFLAKVFLP